MKSIKHCYLIGVLNLALLGSASANTMIVQVTSSKFGFGDANPSFPLPSDGCTLSGAIDSVRQKKSLHGCELDFVSSKIYGEPVLWENGVPIAYDETPIIWADKNEVQSHFLEKTQALDFPVKISLDARFDKTKQRVIFGTNWTGNANNAPIFVDIGMRHFEIFQPIQEKDVELPAVKVTLEGMNLVGALLPSAVNTDGTPTLEDISKAILQLKLAATGGSTIVHTGAEAIFKRVMFQNNKAGFYFLCPNGGDTDGTAEGSAVAVVNARASFLDADFKDNAFTAAPAAFPGGSSCVPRSYDASFGALSMDGSQVALQRASFIHNEGDFASAIFGTNFSFVQMEEVEVQDNYPRALWTTLRGKMFYSAINFRIGTIAQLRAVNISNNYSAALVTHRGALSMKNSAIWKNGLEAIVNDGTAMNIQNSLIDNNLAMPGDLKSVDPTYHNASIRIGRTGFNRGSLSLVHSTITNNYGDAAIKTIGAVNGHSLPLVTFQASILNHTTSPTTCINTNGSGGIPYKSLGANLDNNENTCGLDMSLSNPDRIGVNPLLGNLTFQTQVGPTGFMNMPIRVPYANSPALSNENACSVEDDQVGKQRPIEAPCDSGAYEVQFK